MTGAGQPRNAPTRPHLWSASKARALATCDGGASAGAQFRRAATPSTTATSSASHCADHGHASAPASGHATRSSLESEAGATSPSSSRRASSSGVQYQALSSSTPGTAAQTRWCASQPSTTPLPCGASTVSPALSCASGRPARSSAFTNASSDASSATSTRARDRARTRFPSTPSKVSRHFAVAAAAAARNASGSAVENRRASANARNASMPPAARWNASNRGGTSMPSVQALEPRRLSRSPSPFKPKQA